jgi:hypothetical protein
VIAEPRFATYVATGAAPPSPRKKCFDCGQEKPLAECGRVGGGVLFCVAQLVAIPFLMRPAQKNAQDRPTPSYLAPSRCEIGCSDSSESSCDARAEPEPGPSRLVHSPSQQSPVANSQLTRQASALYHHNTRHASVGKSASNSVAYSMEATRLWFNPILTNAQLSQLPMLATSEISMTLSTTTL